VTIAAAARVVATASTSTASIHSRVLNCTRRSLSEGEVVNGGRIRRSTGTTAGFTVLFLFLGGLRCWCTCEGALNPSESATSRRQSNAVYYSTSRMLANCPSCRYPRENNQPLSNCLFFQKMWIARRTMIGGGDEARKMPGRFCASSG